MPGINKADLQRVLDNATNGLGDYAATYLEKVETGRKREPVKTGSRGQVTVSWGTEDNERTNEVGHKGAVRYWQCKDMFNTKGTDFG